jgi:hypothetical protein
VGSALSDLAGTGPGWKVAGALHNLPSALIVRVSRSWIYGATLPGFRPAPSTLLFRVARDGLTATKKDRVSVRVLELHAPGDSEPIRSKVTATDDWCEGRDPRAHRLSAGQRDQAKQALRQRSHGRSARPRTDRSPGAASTTAPSGAVAPTCPGPGVEILKQPGSVVCIRPSLRQGHELIAPQRRPPRRSAPNTPGVSPLTHDEESPPSWHRLGRGNRKVDRLDG